MASSKNNGYLRQGEFQRWAETVDTRLAQLSDSVKIHGEQLAVFGAYKNMVAAVIAALVAALVAAVVAHWKI